MIGLVTTLWIMVGFFAVVDMQRGWTRVVIATSGLVLSLFAINQFGPFLFGALGHYDEGFSETIWRREIFILAAIHLTIAFFAYAGPAFTGRLSGRLAIRDNIQDMPDDSMSRPTFFARPRTRNRDCGPRSIFVCRTRVSLPYGCAGVLGPSRLPVLEASHPVVNRQFSFWPTRHSLVCFHISCLNTGT